jgi:DNA modification methylase
VKRILRHDGTLWLNISDTYCGTGSKSDHVDPKYPNGHTGQQISLNHRANGCKAKDLIGIPWLLVFALRADGWFLRNDIIWVKANPRTCASGSFVQICKKIFSHNKAVFDGKPLWLNEKTNAVRRKIRSKDA